MGWAPLSINHTATQRGEIPFFTYGFVDARAV